MRKDSQKANLASAMRRGPIKVLAVSSGKGGVGKTNVAANIAVALGARKRNVCLLDADLGLANIDVLLGLQPRFNLSHVVNGEANLECTTLNGPNDIRIIPASSGSFCMTDLPPVSQAAIVQAFSDLADQPDILVVDTAAGISANVARFVQAAQHAIVVVCDEPASLTDAYALIKVFSRHYGISRFQIVTNQCRNERAGNKLFRKLTKVTDLFLDVVLRHLGDVPYDRFLKKSVQEQRAVVEAYPKSPSGEAFSRIALAIDQLPAAREAHGGMEFFLERVLVSAQSYQGMVA